MGRGERGPVLEGRVQYLQSGLGLPALPLRVLSHFEFEGFKTVMPAQAGIQGD